ncbi:PREDICTED: uncharacterized protein LOC108379421 isoform X2 [Rhagoletis zephyria]|uniref:uncharacterized protein LOC118749815 n=1 Tax=Rhagoletis pomonella TaxID=28610 RepID=UPI0008119A62|nr:PREDICTED: uncharacterized protein LOC108379421 isoform X2 [Rhagoletis zephyria]XP_036340480.1 uncharacterized protein LOC118749815 [Rhagoletis pomonella]
MNKRTFQNEMDDMDEKIMENQRQVESRLDVLDHRIDAMEKVLCENMANRNETMAQNRLMRECKVILAKVQQSVGKMTGDIVDEGIVEVASVLPFFTIDAAMEVEEKLNEHEYATAMKTHIHTLKRASGEVDPVMRKLFMCIYIYVWI